MATEQRRNKIQNTVASRQRGLVVVLEDIHDPHNAMAIVRTCEALGVQTVHLIYEKQEGLNPRKVGKSSSSTANKWVDFVQHTSTQSCLEGLKKDGFMLIGTALHEGKAEDIFSADLTDDKLALLVGNEHSGLSEMALSLCDRFLMIPMRGMIESLNVSVATSLCLYEIIRQRGGDLQYFLDENQKAELEKQFLDR